MQWIRHQLLVPNYQGQPNRFAAKAEVSWTPVCTYILRGYYHPANFNFLILLFRRRRSALVHVAQQFVSGGPGRSAWRLSPESRRLGHSRRTSGSQRRAACWSFDLCPWNSAFFCVNLTTVWKKEPIWIIIVRLTLSEGLLPFFSGWDQPGESPAWGGSYLCPCRMHTCRSVRSCAYKWIPGYLYPLKSRCLERRNRFFSEKVEKINSDRIWWSVKRSALSDLRSFVGFACGLLSTGLVDRI